MVRFSVLDPEYVPEMDPTFEVLRDLALGPTLNYSKYIADKF